MKVEENLKKLLDEEVAQKDSSKKPVDIVVSNEDSQTAGQNINNTLVEASGIVSPIAQSMRKSGDLLSVKETKEEALAEDEIIQGEREDSGSVVIVRDKSTLQGGKFRVSDVYMSELHDKKSEELKRSDLQAPERWTELP